MKFVTKPNDSHIRFRESLDNPWFSYKSHRFEQFYMTHDVCDVVTGKFVTIGLYIRNTSDFQIGLRLGKLESKHFIIVSTFN